MKRNVDMRHYPSEDSWLRVGACVTDNNSPEVTASWGVYRRNVPDLRGEGQVRGAPEQSRGGFGALRESNPDTVRPAYLGAEPPQACLLLDDRQRVRTMVHHARKTIALTNAALWNLVLAARIPVWLVVRMMR